MEAARRISDRLALAGGSLLLAMAMLVTASVLRRWFTTQGVPGDFELLQMALALAPAGVIVAVLSPLAGRFIDRFGTTPMIIASMSFFVLGYLWFIVRGGSPEPVYATDYLPSFLLLGLGFAIGFSAVMVQATEGISDDEQGLASGLVQTSGQIGGAIVLAIATSLISVAEATSIAEYRPGLVLVTAVAIVGLLSSATVLLRRRGVPA